MAVGTYIIPDHTLQDGSIYKINLKGCALTAQRLAGAFAPHEQAPPDMTVVLDAGALPGSPNPVEVAAQTTAALVAPAANPRLDRIVIHQTTGAALVVAGTEAASPALPDVPDGYWPVAQVLLQTTTIAIDNTMFTDERLPIAAGSSTAPAASPLSLDKLSANTPLLTSYADIFSFPVQVGHSYRFKFLLPAVLQAGCSSHFQLSGPATAAAMSRLDAVGENLSPVALMAADSWPQVLSFSNIYESSQNVFITLEGVLVANDDVDLLLQAKGVSSGMIILQGACGFLYDLG